MCKFCDYKLNESSATNKLHEKDGDCGFVEIFIECDGSICFNGFINKDTESENDSICVTFDIKYCPMCGKPIHNAEEENRLEIENQKLKDLLKLYL